MCVGGPFSLAAACLVDTVCASCVPCQVVVVVVCLWLSPHPPARPPTVLCAPPPTHPPLHLLPPLPPVLCAPPPLPPLHLLPPHLPVFFCPPQDPPGPQAHDPLPPPPPPCTHTALCAPLPSGPACGDSHLARRPMTLPPPPTPHLPRVPPPPQDPPVEILTWPAGPEDDWRGRGRGRGEGHLDGERVRTAGPAPTRRAVPHSMLPDYEAVSVSQPGHLLCAVLWVLVFWVIVAYPNLNPPLPPKPYNLTMRWFR